MIDIINERLEECPVCGEETVLKNLNLDNLPVYNCLRNSEHYLWHDPKYSSWHIPLGYTCYILIDFERCYFYENLNVHYKGNIIKLSSPLKFSSIDALKNKLKIIFTFS